MALSAKKIVHIGSTSFMLVAMIWLTVSLPVVNAATQSMAKQQSGNSRNSQPEADAASDSAEQSAETTAKFPSEEFLQGDIYHSFGTDTHVIHTVFHLQDNYAPFFADTDIQPPRA